MVDIVVGFTHKFTQIEVLFLGECVHVKSAGVTRLTLVPTEETKPGLFSPHPEFLLQRTS